MYVDGVAIVAAEGGDEEVKRLNLLI